jgi:hypothetical protein
MDLNKYVNENCSPARLAHTSRRPIDNTYLQLAQEALRSHPIGSSAFTKRVKRQMRLSDVQAKEVRFLFDCKVPDWQSWVATIFSETSQLKELPVQLVSVLIMQVREIIYCYHGKFRYNLCKSTMQSASECFLEGVGCPKESCKGIMRGCNYQCADLICTTCEHLVEIKMRNRMSTRQTGKAVIRFGIPEGVKRWHGNGTLVLLCQGGFLFWGAHSTSPCFPGNVGSLDEVVDTKRKTDVVVEFEDATYLWSRQIHQNLQDWSRNRTKYANIMGAVLARVEASLPRDRRNQNQCGLLKRTQRQVNDGLNHFLQLVAA